MPKRSLTDDQKNRIAQLNADGFSQKKIAALYEVAQGTISNALKDKRHDAEVTKLKGAINNAAARGFQAVIEDGTLPIKPIKFIED